MLVFLYATGFVIYFMNFIENAAVNEDVIANADFEDEESSMSNLTCICIVGIEDPVRPEVSSLCIVGIEDPVRPEVNSLCIVGIEDPVRPDIDSLYDII